MKPPKLLVETITKKDTGSYMSDLKARCGTPKVQKLPSREEQISGRLTTFAKYSDDQIQGLKDELATEDKKRAIVSDADAKSKKEAEEKALFEKEVDKEVQKRLKIEEELEKRRKKI